VQYEDYEFFLQNTAHFYQEYGSKFLAIKNKDVIGVYGTFDEALKNTLKTESPGTFLVQECLKSPDDGVVRFQGNVMPVSAKRVAFA
jgi:hypothetical protein